MEVQNEEIIRRFLLGKMSQEERFEFEERFVADADLFEHLVVAEDELIEKYVRGWMKQEESAEFETVFLVTRKRRERVDSVRTFLDQVSGTDFSVTNTVEGNAPKRSYLDAIQHWFSIPKVALGGAMAILVVFVGVWMFSRLFAPNQPEVAFQPDNGAQSIPATTPPPEPFNSAPGNSTETPVPTANVETKQVLTETKTRVPAPTPTIEQPVLNPLLALFSGNLRSGGSNNVLRLSNEAKAATFILNLPSTEYNTYVAVVTDADGNTIAEFNKLQASKGHVRIVVSANQLKKGDYMIRLDGSNVSGERESVADFQFRVKQ